MSLAQRNQQQSPSAQSRKESGKPLTVLFVITGLGMGGAERVVVDLADGLHKRGHRAMIAYLHGDVRVQPEHAEVSLVNLGLDRLWNVPRALFRLRALMKQVQPDVVHCHMFHATVLARVLRLFTRAPLWVSTAHSSNVRSLIRKWAYRLTHRLSDLSTNVSAEAVAAFERDGAVPPGAMCVVHNGIDTGRFFFHFEQRQALRTCFGVNDDSKLLVAVGRLEPPKDHSNLIRALVQVHACRQDWLCLIVGDGFLRPALQRQIEESGLTDHVRLLGVRHDIPSLLSAADYFVLSSAWEGFPLVVGEAMACACPVVATDCGGVAEFLGDYRRFLVPPRDSSKLSAALLDALGVDEKERQLIGMACRKRIMEKFSLNSAIDRWVALYLASYE